MDPVTQAGFDAGVLVGENMEPNDWQAIGSMALVFVMYTIGFTLGRWVGRDEGYRNGLKAAYKAREERP